jgi:hypothetical protein
MMRAGTSRMEGNKTMKIRNGLLLLSMLAGPSIAAMAQDQVKLFKIITQKDEVLIGLTATELQGLGSGPELDNLARHLAADGQMTVWQYAAHKDASGNLQEAPLKRIAVFKTDTLRIEPYSTPLPIVPPEK